MRLTILLLLQCCAITLIHAQQKVSLESETVATRIFDKNIVPKVIGTLENFSASHQAPIIKYKVLTPGLKGQTTRIAHVDVTGKFSIDLDYGLSLQQVFIAIGDHLDFQILASTELYIDVKLDELAKGSSLHWKDAIVFRGKDAGQNIFVNDYTRFRTKKKSQLEKKKFSIMMNHGNNLEDKSLQLKKLYNDFENLELEFAKEYNTDHLWILEDDRKSKMYADLLSLYVGNSMDEKLRSEILSHTPHIISNSANRYYDLLSLCLTYLNKHEENMIIDKAKKIKAAPDEDQALINRFLDVVERKKLGMDYDSPFYDAGIDWYDERYDMQLRNERFSFLTTKLSDLEPSKISMILMKAQPFETKERKLFIDFMEQYINLDWCKVVMRQELKTDIEREKMLSEHLAASIETDSLFELGQLVGKTASGSVLYTSTSESAHELLSTLRNYYHGSAVVVNMWSIWCAPCVSDMRQSKYLENKLSNLPVEIVYLHMHEKSDVERWKEVIGETMVSGDHIYLDQSLSADLLQYLDLTGFPSSFLIDLNGKYDPNCISSLSELESTELRKIIGDKEELVLDK